MLAADGDDGSATAVSSCLNGHFCWILFSRFGWRNGASVLADSMVTPMLALWNTSILTGCLYTLTTGARMWTVWTVRTWSSRPHIAWVVYHIGKRWEPKNIKSQKVNAPDPPLDEFWFGFCFLQASLVFLLLFYIVVGRRWLYTYTVYRQLYIHYIHPHAPVLRPQLPAPFLISIQMVCLSNFLLDVLARLFFFLCVCGKRNIPSTIQPHARK